MAQQDTVAMRAAWDAAFTKVQATKAELDAYTAEVWQPAYDAEKANEEAHGFHGFPETANEHAARRQIPNAGTWLVENIEDHQEALGAAHCNAESTAMATPAPDGEALAWKMDRLFGPEAMDSEDGHVPLWSKAYVAQTIADIARLTGRA